MTVWEIVIVMIIGTICITTGIAFVYSSIVNTIERYQRRKTVRELEIFTKIMESIPGMFTKMVEIVAEKEKERNANIMDANIIDAWKKEALK